MVGEQQKTLKMVGEQIKREAIQDIPPWQLLFSREAFAVALRSVSGLLLAIKGAQLWGARSAHSACPKCMCMRMRSTQPHETDLV
eukprot:6175455-Pleurochrysis_carterae.AAC.2